GEAAQVRKDVVESLTRQALGGHGGELNLRMDGEQAKQFRSHVPAGPGDGDSQHGLLRALPLRVLELRAGPRLPVLLALAHPRIARQEPRALEGLAELVVEMQERASDTVAHGSRLPRWPAAADVDDRVELPQRAGEGQRLADHHAQRFARE